MDDYTSIDLISMLPDEILVCILSFLPYKEAIATSILSHRWRYMWTFVITLNFDGTESMLKVGLSENWVETLKENSINFVRWVDHIISSLKNLVAIKEFRVFYNLNNSHADSIDKWLDYAFARKVERLELNLTKDDPFLSRILNEFYEFPRKFISGSIDLKPLKTIATRMVNLDDKTIEFFFQNCPLLEELSVSHSCNLPNLKIVDPPSSFKRLEIIWCRKLKSVEIRRANLVHLKYYGKKIGFVFEDVPLLTSLSLGRYVTDDMQHLISMFSSVLPQLEIFDIYGTKFSLLDTKLFNSSVKMRCLKELVVGFFEDHRYSLLSLAKLIDASPRLERFVLKGFYRKPKFSKRKIKRLKINCAHLKIVEFKGYRGLQSDREMIMNLYRNAPNLNKIVIDTINPANSPFLRKAYNCYPRYAIFIKDEVDARALAIKQLPNLVPSKIKLDILGPSVEMKVDAKVQLSMEQLRREREFAEVFNTDGQVIGFRQVY